MKASLTTKISGDRDEVKKIIETLEKDWQVRVTSKFINNYPEQGVHLFIVLTPKNEA